MADGEKGNSTDQILQAFDALSNLYQARAGANRRTTSLALPGAGDNAAVEEARPRPRHRRRLSSPRSPFWSKPNKLDKNENYDDGVEEGDDAAFIVIVRGRGLPLMLPLDKKEVDDYDEEDDDDSTNSTATTEADGEKKGIMSWGPIRAASHIGMRRIGCLFSLEVVAAQGLPPSLNGLRVAVTVRRKETRDGAVQTMPARVQLGVVHFGEALYMRCHLYDTGGNTTDKPLSFEPQPFLVYLVAIHAPELDFGRSTVDLSLFAKEFTDNCQQGECVRQWDMVFPLDRKAKGGELVVKLSIQSIDDGGTGSYSQRKLRMPSLSNMLTSKMTRTNSPKMGVSAPELLRIDSFMLDEPDLELTPVVEVEEEEQQKESERELADEPTSVVEVKEDQQKETESEPANEPTPMAEVKEEQQKQEPERELADEPTPVAEVKEEQEPEREPADEPTLEAEVKGEQQKKTERESADEPTPVPEMKEEDQRKKEPECELADEPTPVAEVKEEEQEPDRKPADDPTPEFEVKEEEQQREPGSEPADERTRVAEVEEEQQREPEREPADERTAVAEVKEEEQQKKEPEREPADELIPEAKVQEGEQQKKEPEHEPEVAQQEDDSELLEFNAIDRGIEGQEVESELKEEVEANTGFEEEVSLVAGDEVTKAVANGLQEKSVEATMLNDVSEVVVDAVELMDVEAGRPEEITGESLQVQEQREDKDTAAKPSRRPRFKWRTVALLVPIAVTFSKTLGAGR